MIEASATKRFSVPYTCPVGVTTAPSRAARPSSRSRRRAGSSSRCRTIASRHRSGGLVGCRPMRRSAGRVATPIARSSPRRGAVVAVGRTAARSPVDRSDLRIGADPPRASGLSSTASIVTGAGCRPAGSASQIRRSGAAGRAERLWKVAIAWSSGASRPGRRSRYRRRRPGDRTGWRRRPADRPGPRSRATEGRPTSDPRPQEDRRAAVRPARQHDGACRDRRAVDQPHAGRPPAREHERSTGASGPELERGASNGPSGTPSRSPCPDDGAHRHVPTPTAPGWLWSSTDGNPAASASTIAASCTSVISRSR